LFVPRKALFLKHYKSFFFFLTLTPLAYAGNITVSYSGTMWYSQLPGISVGDPFSGYMTYSVPSPVYASGSEVTEYSIDQPGDGLYFTADNYWFSAGPSDLLVMSEYPILPSDPSLSLVVIGQNIDGAGADFTTNYPAAYTFTQTEAEFVGNPSFVTSFALPNPFNTSDLILGEVLSNDFYYTEVGIFVQEGSSTFAADGIIDSIEVTSETPEPSGFLLFGFGLAMIFVRTRARSERSRSANAC
jgi:hypothetical protein